MRHGTVHLVGSGPGDPELLTCKALRILQEVDVVVYDKLVSQAILDLIPEGTTRIFVGKSSGNHALPQEEITQLLVQLSYSGRSVARLKGGDPFVFGRGGEEMLVLREFDVPYEVTPGITAAMGCAAGVGIPLTHRTISQSVQFVTGHARSGGSLDLPWDQLSDGQSTVVIYMGVGQAGTLQEAFLSHGMAADTPVAIIENGTQPDQRLWITCIGSLAEEVCTRGVRPPALLLVGDVVSLADPRHMTQERPKLVDLAASM